MGSVQYLHLPLKSEITCYRQGNFTQEDRSTRETSYPLQKDTETKKHQTSPKPNQDRRIVLVLVLVLVSGFEDPSEAEHRGEQ